MPIEGISMTTVFSLVVVGLVFAISAFIGGYFLAPVFEIEAVMAGVAYDIAAMHDIAYTLPGEVVIRYYGPSACFWNYNQPSDEATSFHCFSGEAVLINDVFITKETLLITNDTYMRYDYDPSNPLSLNPEGVYTLRPALLSINIPYYNAQVCPFNLGAFSYCALAYAPFAASYKDLDILAASTPYSVEVKDYAFVVSKKNVGNYYTTIDTEASNPDNLITFLTVLSTLFNNLCSIEPEFISPGTYYYAYDRGALKDIPAVTGINTGEYFVQLVKGNRWRIYEDRIICQERISLSDEDIGNIYVERIDDDNFIFMETNTYVIDYCFDLEQFFKRSNCYNIDSVIFSDTFISMINGESEEGIIPYKFYASQSSCIKPYFIYNTNAKTLEITGVRAEFNYFTGVCN